MTITTTPAYELWDVETGNLIGYYPDEAAAFLAIREGVNDDGLEHWGPVTLLRVEPDGQHVAIAQGAALVARALGGPGGTISVGGRSFDAAQVVLGLALLDVLASPAFMEAMRGLRVALISSNDETRRDIERVRAAVGKVSKATGVPVRVETQGARLALVTPDKSMASLLALGMPLDVDRPPMPVRAVEDGYAVDIAA
jgi:hypothetical protein